MSASALNLTPATTMGELVAKFPGAQRALFRGYHIGGCSSCGFQMEESLEQVCVRNGGLLVADVIAFLGQAQESDRLMEVTPKEADALVKAGKARLVDIRTREEFDAVHIEGAVPFTESLMSELPGWDRAQQIIFVCHHGVRSMDAAAYFAGHGLENVRSMSGGIDAWSCEVDVAVPRYDLE